MNWPERQANSNSEDELQTSLANVVYFVSLFCSTGSRKGMISYLAKWTALIGFEPHLIDIPIHGTRWLLCLYFSNSNSPSVAGEGVVCAVVSSWSRAVAGT
jgi:hypothetical protein